MGAEGVGRIAKQVTGRVGNIACTAGAMKGFGFPSRHTRWPLFMLARTVPNCAHDCAREGL
jgi:hypothetical protein